ncbi:MAG: hypothetical protein D8H97_37380 [Neisseria sp.]|jgi:hypothetical protein|nr:MAG: hypothetical protein D8H97_37380 [Neisseria sp.]
MIEHPHWFYFYILPLMPTVLTIAGWFIVASRENSRRVGDRKSKRIDEVCALTKMIESEALHYYTQLPADSAKLTISILHNLKWVSILCGKISPDLTAAVTDFRISVSGGDFQSARQSIMENDPKIIKIRESAFMLRCKLDSCHDDQ